jgi:hypothetical protein
MASLRIYWILYLTDSTSVKSQGTQCRIPHVIELYGDLVKTRVPASGYHRKA